MSGTGWQSEYFSHKERLPRRRAHQGVQLIKASSISNAEIGQLTLAFHHGLWDLFPHGDLSIYNMGIKKFPYAHPQTIITLLQLLIYHSISKSLTLRIPTRSTHGSCPTFTLLPPTVTQ